MSTRAFRVHAGVSAPILEDNVDTDQIIPSREMKSVSNQGLADGLFAGWRYHYKGTTKTGPNTEFVLNKPEYAGTSIVLSGKNFGCGSSREHAVWALRDYGIRVLIAESFGRIFRNNCARNGVLAVQLDATPIKTILEDAALDPQNDLVTVDLEQCIVVTPKQNVFNFEVEDFDRTMLLEGLDHIDYTLQFESDIDLFVDTDRIKRRWAHL